MYRQDLTGSKNRTGGCTMSVLFLVLLITLIIDNSLELKLDGVELTLLATMVLVILTIVALILDKLKQWKYSR